VTWLGAVAGVGTELTPWLLELELLEPEELEPSSPAADEPELPPSSPARAGEDPELVLGEDARDPDAVAEWVEPGRIKATAPAVASPARPAAAVTARTRARPRWRAAAADSRSRCR
jgi:hypothetical protein